jgi:hypothetical protein
MIFAVNIALKEKRANMVNYFTEFAGAVRGD